MTEAFAHHLLSVDGRGVAWVTLNRPELHNAFDDRLIAELTGALTRLGGDPGVRVVVLAGAGRSFSAGADLNWMRAMAAYDEERNRADAERLAVLMRTLDRLPKPTVAKVQGPALAGGCGLVACCDIVIAGERASFGLSEVRLGIIPAVIGPYMVAAIGARAARRYFLTGERFGAHEAHRLGLVSDVVADGALEDRVAALVATLLDNGPCAVAEAKAHIAAIAGRPIDEAMIADSAARIARLRASPEGREGIGAFLEKRKPDWQR